MDLDKLNNNLGLISVIVPVYNSAHLISRLLESLVQQSYKAFEVLICDDGSTDNLKEVIESYKSKLNIRYFKNDNFGGPAVPRNIGIKNSKGEFLAFVDADDWWKKDKLKICIESFDQDTDLIFHDLIIFRENYKFIGKRIIRGAKLELPIFKSLILKGNIICNSSVVVRKSIMIKSKGFSENKDMIAAEDYNAWLRISKVSNNFKYINKALGFYYINHGISSDRDMSKPTKVAMNEFINDLENEENREVFFKLSYMSGIFNLTKYNFNVSIKKLKISSSSSNLKVKIKSYAIIILIYFLILFRLNK